MSISNPKPPSARSRLLAFQAAVRELDAILERAVRLLGTGLADRSITGETSPLDTARLLVAADLELAPHDVRGLLDVVRLELKQVRRHG
jgi:hypothetical protein